MYKPCKISEMVTVATHYKLVEGQQSHGYTTITKVLADNPTIRGKFKLKGTSEISANGLKVVNEKTTFTTWYSVELESGDILTIDGKDYSVIGTAENVENRKRYSILNLEVYVGGA